jgi:hypothetical protein
MSVSNVGLACISLQLNDLACSTGGKQCDSNNAITSFNCYNVVANAAAYTMSCMRYVPSNCGWHSQVQHLLHSYGCCILLQLLLLLPLAAADATPGPGCLLAAAYHAPAVPAAVTQLRALPWLLLLLPQHPGSAQTCLTYQPIAAGFIVLAATDPPPTAAAGDTSRCTADLPAE